MTNMWLGQRLSFSSLFGKIQCIFEVTRMTKQTDKLFEGLGTSNLKDRLKYILIQELLPWFFNDIENSILDFSKFLYNWGWSKEIREIKTVPFLWRDVNEFIATLGLKSLVPIVIYTSVFHVIFNHRILLFNIAIKITWKHKYKWFSMLVLLFWDAQFIIFFQNICLLIYEQEYHKQRFTGDKNVHGDE